MELETEKEKVRPDYFDIHTHVNLKPLIEKKEEVIERCLKENIWMTNVGTDIETSSDAVSIAESYKEGVYATVGFHPHNVFKKEKKERKIDLSSSEKVVSIGDCGLDYFYTNDNDTIRLQKELFDQQIEIANTVKKPLMLHIRNGSGGDAYRDVISMLKNRSFCGGNAHFFSGTVDDAKALFSLGFTVSFTGVITFTRDYDDVISLAPIDMIMSETDAPYVAPISIRGKENQPFYVKDIACRIAEIRKEDSKKVLFSLVDNAFGFFNI